MVSMETEHELLSITLHFMACILLFSSVLLWLRRHCGDRARVYLSFSSMMSGLALMIRVHHVYTSVPISSQVLPVVNLNGGFLVLLLLYLYPIEVINPGWLTKRRLFLLFLPWLLLNVALAVMPVQFRELSGFGEMWSYAGEFNVWFRLLILFACIVPYTIMFFHVPYNWRRSRANCRWIYCYAAGIQVIGVLYTLFMLTGWAVVSNIHLVYCSCFALFVTYQELYVRIPVPVSAEPQKTAEPQKPAEPQEKPAEPQKEPAPSNPLWEKLLNLMNEEELWRNPDISLVDLAKKVGTNRTTLSQLIRQNGYPGYKEFINRRRIDELLKIIGNGNIQEAFYEVGFRSKMTALRYFRDYVGTTPSEYLHRLSDEGF